jgi:FAD/FMN-containing dehydrogenase
MEDFIQNLRYRISTNSAILTQDDPRFPAAHERWTDIDRKTPAVIVQPTSEHDVAVLVSYFSQALPSL